MKLSLLKFGSTQVMSLVALLLFCSYAARGQTVNDSSNQVPGGTEKQMIEGLQKQIGELRDLLTQMNKEMALSRQETRQLREELETMRQGAPQMNVREVAVHTSTAAQQSGETQTASVIPSDTEDRLKKVEENQELDRAALRDQYQTKVESASKFRVRLSGALIFNLLNNRGPVDNLDFPALVPPSGTYGQNGSFGMSLRQSLLGLEVFGPDVGGLHVSGNVQFDFAGGFNDTSNGAVLGLPRLRTGTIRFSGPKTDIVAGQDTPFISPLSPSSLASTALPAFSYSGNLWTWIPQVRIEHRVTLSDRSSFLLQGGILDPLAGETPPSQSYRVPGPGEASRQPAYATRIAWRYRLFDRELTLGVGGYYSRQNWGHDRNVDAWAGTSDWIFPLANRWELSGEFYRGRALGGLGGGVGRSVITSGSLYDPYTQVYGLDAIGGWAQLKFRQTDKLEWNGVFGEDNSFADDLRSFPMTPFSYTNPSIARNRGFMGNFIYRPRSDLMFSLEYQRLRTFTIQGTSPTADVVGLSMGLLF